jgi:hypothetical protein
MKSMKTAYANIAKLCDIFASDGPDGFVWIMANADGRKAVDKLFPCFPIDWRAFQSDRPTWMPQGFEAIDLDVASLRPEAAVSEDVVVIPAGAKLTNNGFLAFGALKKSDSKVRVLMENDGKFTLIKVTPEGSNVIPFPTRLQ